jgi:hypothetical protein
MVLALQDTTELNFSHHPGKQGLGYLDNANSRGLKVHSVMCVTQAGVPLGVLHQQVWARDPANLGKKHQRHQKLTKDKESQRWLTALEATQSVIPEEIQVLTVADREADIYDLFALPRRGGSDFLIRAAHNRSVKRQADNSEVELLNQHSASYPLRQLTLELQRNPQRSPRLQPLTLRFATLELQPPQAHLSAPPCNLSGCSHPGRGRKSTSNIEPLLAAVDHTPSCWLDDVVQCLRV